MEYCCAMLEQRCCSQSSPAKVRLDESRSDFMHRDEVVAIRVALMSSTV